ncbi:MAG: NYN domain-containing protein [Phycisphaerales bacterium]|nr:NYN domain-containing protein [Phycisphaerales bacterium]
MLLIDVSNVLHTTGVLPPEIAGIDVDGLVRLLGISRYAKRRMVLACDGHPGRGRPAPSGASGHAAVEIVYAGTGRQADDVLIERMNASHHGKHATLVSSDRELISVANRRGLRSLTSASFLLQLSTDHRLSPVRAKARDRNERPEFAKRVPLPAAEVGVWLKLLLGQTATQSTPAKATPASPAPAHSPRPTTPAQSGPSRSGHDLDPQQEHALRELLAQVDEVMSRFPGEPVGARGSSPKERRPAARKPDRHIAAAGEHDREVPGPVVQVDPELARLLQDFSVELHLPDLEKMMNAPGAAPPRATDDPRRGKPRSQGRRR